MIDDNSIIKPEDQFGPLGEAYREVIREQGERIDRLVFKLSQAQELITELTDALVNENHIWFNEGDDLIQRARNTTK